MSDNLRKYLKNLEFISTIKCIRTRNSLLRYLSRDPKIFLALREIALNIIKGHVDMDSTTKAKLHLHKNNLINLSYKRKIPAKNRKKLVVQSGGWLWIIPVITALFEIIK